MSEITPDTRDWTDVLAGGCSECGFTGTEDPTVVPATLAEAAATWQTVLTRDDATERRSPDRWSDVEYASHMRDVLDEFRRRTERMLTETDPTLDNFDGDTVAVESDYAHADPAEVAPALRAAAESYAGLLSKLSGEEWDRRGFRSDGHSFTVASLTLYGLHEVRHHLGDVGA
ncbi:DinB family protein [Brevibacterium linens]|uniref:DinB-like domain containing protein n=1 Tax=Brevibacterium linens TaxID=1703 RepID=A0A0B9AJN1_BRELN|nr:DinB family protein [Brevibacterium linens]KHS50944.1 DinB-like domain containing protein [Brevibacterium linens]